MGQLYLPTHLSLQSTRRRSGRWKSVSEKRLGDSREIIGPAAHAGFLALGTTGVLFGKHIDKIHDDTAKGILTLPVILGERRARAASIGIFALMYILVVLLVVVGWLPWLALLVFLSLPRARLAVKAFHAPKPTGQPEGYPKESWPLWFVDFAFLLNRDYGGLFTFALVVAVILQALGVPLLYVTL